MKKVKQMFVLLLWVVLFIFGSTPHTEAQDANAYEIIRLVNQYRINQGLAPFTINNSLMEAAQNQADYMATNNIYSHYGWGGSTPRQRAAAAGFNGPATENIVGGSGMTPAFGLNWWINSPIHHATLVSSYTEIGGGYAYGYGQHFFAIVVGSSNSASVRKPQVVRPIPTSTRVPAPVVEQNYAQPEEDNSAPAEEQEEPYEAPVAEPVAVEESPAVAEEIYSPPPIVVTPITLSQPKSDGSIVHIMGAGQALWTLSVYYDVDLQHLMRINNLREGDYPKVGDRIYIRLADGQPTPTLLPTPTPQPYHILREGESLWSVATRYQVSMSDLLAMNNLTIDTLVRTGETLRVHLLPGESLPPTATPAPYHIVKDGENVWSISSTYGISVDELNALNGLAPEDLLHEGDQLWVVVATPIPTATPTSMPRLEESAEPTPLPTPTETPQSPTPASVLVKIIDSEPTFAPITLTPTPTEQVVAIASNISADKLGNSLSSIARSPAEAAEINNTTSTRKLYAMSAAAPYTNRTLYLVALLVAGVFLMGALLLHRN